MNLQEMLKTPEAKKMYRELSQEHHPDKGGSAAKMKMINAAKDSGDDALIRVYEKLKKTVKMPEEKKVYSDLRYKEGKSSIETFKDISAWLRDLEKTFFDKKFLLIPRKSGKEINITVTNLFKPTDMHTGVFIDAEKHAQSESIFRSWFMGRMNEWIGKFI